MENNKREKKKKQYLIEKIYKTKKTGDRPLFFNNFNRRSKI